MRYVLRLTELHRTGLCLTAALVASVLLAPSAGGAVVVPLAKTPPVVDGRIDPAEWASAAVIDGLLDGGQLVQRRAVVYVSASAGHIHLALRTQLPQEGRLLTKADRDGLKVLFDDAVEAVVNAAPDSPESVAVGLVANSAGQCGWFTQKVGGPAAPASPAGWKHAHGLHDGWWHFECTIPIAALPGVAPGRKVTDGTWAIDLVRDWKWPWQRASLSGGDWPAGLPFAFSDSPVPAVRAAFSRDPSQGGFAAQLTLANPHAVPLDLAAAASLDRNNMPALRQEARLHIPPGQEKTLTLSAPADDPTQHYALALRVASADGKALYLDRRLAWPRLPALRYVASEPAAAAVSFRFAYYPYLNRMRILADVTGLPATARLSHVTADVAERLTGRVVKSVVFPAASFGSSGRCEQAFDVPPLAGLYRILVRAHGEGIDSSAAAIRDFERTVYPWEHAPVGVSTQLYPPFEPIRMDPAKRTLATVLREHTLNELGLPDQIVCRSAHTGIAKPILAGPSRYVVRVGGQVQAVQAGPLTFAEVRPDRVVTQSAFTAGPLRAASRGIWDYDGCLRTELTLQSSAGQRIDELTLEIDLADEQTPLIHANSDRIRAPVAQRVPPGQGVVWTGDKVACDDFLKGFCPYVYLGSAVRGLCWFAENDAGWSWDPKTPNLSVVRAGPRLTLRVHLINRPVVIDQPRRIVFGLLAAPVKPRLSPGGPGGWRYRYVRDDYTLLGTDVNWLALNTCGSVYPAGRDLYLWEMLARANRQKLSPQEIESVRLYGRRYFEPYGPDALKAWDAHVRYNLTSRTGKKMVFYYNRASFQAAEEFETFKDEWGLTDFRSTEKGDGLGEIKVVPTASYIDHALYWYGRSFEIGGNRGVYWDNFFIAPSFNTELTDAYARPDGSIAPAAGIWSLRELARRTFIMMNERGMLPITFPHMTSFNPLPLMSFATVQYDWEWKYSEGDVQDRFTRDLLLLVSTGELAGVWPVPLTDMGKLANDDWTQRTFTAVRMVHELDGHGGWGFSWMSSHRKNRPLMEPILRLLDQDGLQVYRYWDDRPTPVRSDNADVPTIVYSLPGKQAVVGVVSYAPADAAVQLQADLAALKLAPNAKVRDAETGAAVEMKDGKIVIQLKKHDVKVLVIGE